MVAVSFRPKLFPSGDNVRRVLSIDGGGIKGALPSSFLATIERATGGRIVDQFDLIAGTSTGGIIALGLGLGFSATARATAAGDTVVVDLKEFAKQQFKAAQQPAGWLLTAERLRDAADAILKHELPAEIPYLQAHKIAEEEAVAGAYSDENDAGVAETKAMTRPIARLRQRQIGVGSSL